MANIQSLTTGAFVESKICSLDLNSGILGPVSIFLTPHKRLWFDMKKLDFYFKPKDASSTKSFDTSQAGVSDSLPESLQSPLDSQKN